MLCRRVAMIVVCLVLGNMNVLAASVNDTGPESSRMGGSSPTQDPFRCLISDPKVEPTRSEPHPEPLPPPIAVQPPLKLAVAAVASEGAEHLAILRYEGNDYIVEEGWESDDHAFVVKSVVANAAGKLTVQVFDRRANRVQRISEGKTVESESSSGAGEQTQESGIQQ